MKVSFFEIKKWEEEYVSQKLKPASLVFSSEALSKKNITKAKDSQIISVFIYSKINKGILEKLPKLKLIATRSTGFDHIDLEECRKRNITVVNVPFYGENTVAEHTFALILALSRNIHKSYVRTLRDDFSIKGLKGFDLKGKTLGVVGAGHIGLHVIRIARSFGMKVLAFDVKKDNFVAEVLDFKYVSLKKLLGEADIVSLHVPYNKNTHHLINKETIQLMKPGAILINTARGKVVETEAIIEALKNKTLAGAGLDVLENETLIKENEQLLWEKGKLEELREVIKDHVLLNMENVVFTPHIAFYSQEALERILETTIKNIKGFIEGKPENIVNS